MSSPVLELAKGAIGGLIQPITQLYTKKEERKQAKDAIKGQIAMAKQQGATEVSIKASDWEIASKGQEGGTWKDEYITVSIMSIFNAVILGSIMLAFGSEAGGALVTGVLEGIKTIDALDGTVGEMIKVTVYAGLSIKIVKDVIR
tara:strand:+ start:245 stop:679 length:435 start_codon:yes stop_codon:yes gene_type:complete